MALVDINLKPDKKTLKEFGEIALAMINVLGLLLLMLGRIGADTFVFFAIAALTVYLVSKISQTGIKYIYLTLVIATFPIGWLVSHLVMIVFYFGVLGTVSGIFRVIGRDALKRKYNKNAGTYWETHEDQRQLSDYFNQS